MTMTMFFRIPPIAIPLLLLLLQGTITSSFTFHPSTNKQNVRLHAKKLEETATTRRESIQTFLGVVLSSTTLIFPPSNAVVAAAKPSSSSSSSYSVQQQEQDKQKIVDGYKRLNYLLDNWEKETVICKRVDNPYLGCERNPEKVMEYLGFKSMKDPLFRADKTLIRLQSLAPPDKLSDFQDAIETWLEKAEEGSGMAFVSSWGEANPGGGKDRVELFIERSKKDVIEARDCLKTVIDILELLPVN